MIQLSLKQTGKAYIPYWLTCVGAGRANEGLRAAFQKQLAQLQEQIGFSYLRFHGLFHDDMFVVRQAQDGSYIYNFQYIDELFDAMLEKHIRPFVELGFFPDCLKGGDAAQFWWKGHVTPPERYDGWCALIDRFIRHLLSRYGAEEVRTWYFEVWNEPNLHGFWDGTRSQYFELYRQTVTTIKAIDPLLRTGGPATSNFVPDSRFDGETQDVTKQITHQVKELDDLLWRGVWIKDFLAFCEENALPMDFISTHPYPTDFALDTTGRITGRSRGVDALMKDLTWLKETLLSSAYPEAEIHLTEWSSSPTPRDCTHDYLQEAAFIIKCNLDCIGLTNSLSYWTFTDVFEELGAGDSIFHGGFGLINYQGIVKPGFHAYRMLSALGNELLYRDEHSFITRKEQQLSGILYNYPLRESVSISRYPDRSIAEAELSKGEAYIIHLRLTDLCANQCVSFELLDREHGWALPLWQKMGCPEPPDREQTKLLREAALATKKWIACADEHGVLNLDISIEPWSVIHFISK